MLPDASSLPDTFATNGVSYPVIGQIQNDEPIIHSPEAQIAKYLQHYGTSVEYRWCDLVEQQAAGRRAADKAAKQKEKRSAKKNSVKASASAMAKGQA